MPTRTWLTTPPDQAPADVRGADGERYVPGPDLPQEPRLPGRHRRAVALLTVVLVTAAIVATLVIVGEQALSEDPSVPDTSEPPGTSGDEPPEQLELPES